MKSRLPHLASLALAACGQPAPAPDAATANEQPAEAQPSPSPDRSAVLQERAARPLPLAEPAPSALFHAAYQRVEDRWEPIIYLCDGVDARRVKLITTPDARGLSALWTYAKPDFRTTSTTVRLGDEDPGAGQIHRELRRPDGTVIGSVHSNNPGVRGDASVTTLPTLSGITDVDGTTRCRWMARGRVLLVDARRSVLVTLEADGSYTYRSFDHARPGAVVDTPAAITSTPTVTVAGGRLVASDEPGRETYAFRKAPWEYRVTASADNRSPGATLTVLRDGKAVQTSTAAAYQMAARRIE